MSLIVLLNLFSRPLFTVDLHDPVTLALVTLVVTIILGFITIVVSVVLVVYQVRRQRGQKQMTYRILADRSVLWIDGEIKGRIKIEFDGRVIDDVSLIIVKVWNSGDTSIKAGDYLEPVTFQFEGRKVLETDIRAIEPANLIKPADIQKFLQDSKSSAGNEKESIELPSFHLNPKKRGSLQDAFTFGILLLGTPRGKISVEGRIDEGNIVKFKRIKIALLLISITILIVGSVIAFLFLGGSVSFAANG